MCFQFEFFAAAADVAAVAVGHGRGHSVLVQIASRLLFVVAQIELVVRVPGGHFQAAVTFPVLPARMAQPTLHMRRTPRVPLVRDSCFKKISFNMCWMRNVCVLYVPLQDSHAFPPRETAGSGFPLLLPFTTPLLLFNAAGLGLLLEVNISLVWRLPRLYLVCKSVRA